MYEYVCGLFCTYIIYAHILCSILMLQTFLTYICTDRHLLVYFCGLLVGKPIITAVIALIKPRGNWGCLQHRFQSRKASTNCQESNMAGKSLVKNCT